MEKDYLYKNVVDNFEGFFHKDGWLTVYDNLENLKEIDKGGIYCAFINTAQALTNSLSSHNWDLMIGHNGPTIIESFDKGKKRTKYFSRGHKNIDHFVIHRSEFGYYDNYLEIAEEFRLYYNLYEQRKNNEIDYIYIDSNGDENIIVKIEKNNRVLVKYNALIDFISTKKVFFVIFFDFMLFSKKPMNELGLKETNDNKQSDSFMYNLLIRDAQGFGSDMAKTQSWLMGKYIIKPKKNYKINLFFSLDSDQNKYVDFIYDFDANGNPISFTCNEDKLANYFGKNPDNPQYVTPIYFKKDVLTKYYDNPKKYTVSDGYVSCEGLWFLRLDNSCKNYVVAFLGDLGKLSYKEQLYWKSFNIEKQKGLSYTGFSRAFLGEPANPESPDLYFKMIYRSFCENSFRKNGWCFFKPLEKEDNHYFSTLHVLADPNNEKEFDNQVLSLTKVLIDSINEKELSKYITIEKEDKGIDKLDKYLCYKRGKYPELISFLKNLQDLRSSTVAHRRSNNNRNKIKSEDYFKISEKPLSDVLDDIFEKSIRLINTLQSIEETNT